MNDIDGSSKRVSLETESVDGSVAPERPPLRKATHPLIKAFSIVESVAGDWWCGAVVVFIMFFVVAEITARKLFNYSFFGIVDIVGLCIVVTTFGAISIVQKKNSHIKVDIFEKKFAGKRSGDALECIILLIVLGVISVLFYSTGKLALSAFQEHYTTMSVYLPQWPAVIFMPIGYLLLVIRLIAGIKQSITRLIRPGVENGTQYDGLKTSV